MKPKHKSKMCQKQWERARANRAESKETKKPKTTSAKQMRMLWERCTAETLGVVSKPGVASTSRAAQAMDIDTDNEQSTQRQTESEDEMPVRASGAIWALKGVVNYNNQRVSLIILRDWCAQKTIVYYRNMLQAISGTCSQRMNTGMSVMFATACGFYGI